MRIAFPWTERRRFHFKGKVMNMQLSISNMMMIVLSLSVMLYAMW
jgi:hypothetical protein